MLRLTLGFCAIAVACMILSAAAIAQVFSLAFHDVNDTILTQGAPFQAQKTVRLQHKLADGTVISRETKGRIARDSAGRYCEELRETITGGKSPDTASTIVNVLDPVQHRQFRWASDSTQYSSWSLLDRLGVTPVNFPPPIYPERNHLGLKSENKVIQELGQKLISGVMAGGTRTTTTIPAGILGNDRPLISTDEVWISPELKIVVLEKLEDPLYGEKTVELQNIKRTEPDSALFRVPDGYSKKPDLPMGGIIARPAERKVLQVTPPLPSPSNE
jgi:hypothetical protein